LWRAGDGRDFCVDARASSDCVGFSGQDSDFDGGAFTCAFNR